MPQGLVLHTCYQNAFLGMTWLSVAVANPKSLDNTVTPWKLKAWTFTLKCWQFLAFHFFCGGGGKGEATSTWHLPLDSEDNRKVWNINSCNGRPLKICRVTGQIKTDGISSVLHALHHSTGCVQLTIKLERIYFYSSRSNYLSFCLFQTLLKSFLNKYLCSIIIIFSWKKGPTD